MLEKTKYKWYNMTIHLIKKVHGLRGGTSIGKMSFGVSLFIFYQ